MYCQEQEPTSPSRRQNASSDEEYQSQKQQSPQKPRDQNNNDDVIDQKEEVRQVSVSQICMQEQGILQELIKEEHLEELETKYEESEIDTEKNIMLGDDSSTNLEECVTVDKAESNQLHMENMKDQAGQSQSSPQQKTPKNQRSIMKSLSLTSTQSIRYLHPSSSQLFIGPHSLLPNEIVCIQNNSTRVIIHMNKKIVPIPSSYTSDSKSSKNISPQKSRTTLPSVQCPYLLGKLIVTNYKLIYMDSLYPNTMTFCLPLNYIFKVQRTNQQSTGISHIEIWFKTGLSIKLKYHQEEYSYSQKIKDIIMTLMHKNLHSAVDLGEQQTDKTLLCKKYGDKYFQEDNVKREIKGIQAEIVHNHNWEESLFYPEKYVVPLRYIGKRNVETRLVVLSYVYTIQNQKLSLWRTGPGNVDPFEQEWIAKAKFSNKHYVIQVKNKGIGISKTQANRMIEIESLYLLRESFQKVHQITYHNHESMKWLGGLCGTRWYEQVAMLMNEALHVIEMMTSKVSVTLVCDTEARGAQITAIVQLLMNPFYRTFEGFPCLIEKQFLHYGCPKPGKKEREQDKSVILIQFLDCVYQFTHLYPLSFQFSEHYLVFLAEHVFSNKYGNFLYITRQLKKETDRRQVVEKCVCIWSDIKRKIETDKKTFFQIEQIRKPLTKKPTRKSILSPPIHQIVNYFIYFRNSFYIDHNQSNIFELKNHSQISKGIKLWSSYFSKKVYCTESIKEQVLFSSQIEKRYFKIAYEHNLMKKTNEIMRKKLSEQYSRIAEKKQQLKALKDL